MTEHLQSRAFTFKDINAKNCHVAGAYIFGLPESKVEKLTFENINFSYAKDAKPGGSSNDAWL